MKIVDSSQFQHLDGDRFASSAPPLFGRSCDIAQLCVVRWRARVLKESEFDRQLE